MKLTATTTILEEARARRRGTAIVALPNNAGELIRQFEDHEELNEDLRGQELSGTGTEIAKTNGKLIQISQC